MVDYDAISLLVTGKQPGTVETALGPGTPGWVFIPLLSKVLPVIPVVHCAHHYLHNCGAPPQLRACHHLT